MTPCINPFQVENISLENVELHTQILVDVFEELIPEAKLSNYMKTILKPCISAVLLSKHGSFKDIQLMMQSAKCEQWVQEGKQSLIAPHREFFNDEYMNRLFDFTKNSIYTKLQSLLNSPTFYNFTT